MIDVGGVLVLLAVADVTFSVALIFYGTKLSGNYFVDVERIAPKSSPPGPTPK